MRMVRRCFMQAICGVMFASVAVPASAQVCGDATGNGVVTEADGLEVLRAAALLPNQCAGGVCDVNGDGATDCTDAVLTLRLAADLPVDTACDSGGGVASEVETLSADVTPFFGVLLPESPGVGVAGAGGFEVTTEDCPAGGTRTNRDLVTQLQVSFDLCRIDDPLLGSFEIDGTVALNLALPQFFITADITDLANGRTVNFEGPIDATFGSGDTVIFDGGPVVIATPQGNFDMTFDGMVVDSDGRPRDGAASAADTDDNFALDVVTFVVNDDVTANLLADFDDGSSASFLLNFVTGVLTPLG